MRASYGCRYYRGDRQTQSHHNDCHHIMGPTHKWDIHFFFSNIQYIFNSVKPENDGEGLDDHERDGKDNSDDDLGVPIPVATLFRR